MTKPNHPDYIWTRQKAVEASLVQAREMNANLRRTLKMHIPDVKDYFAPVFPGQVVCVLGQSSSGKSRFMESWYEDHARRLVEEDRNEIPVVVHLEDTIEEVFWTKISNRTGMPLKMLAEGKVDDWGKYEMAAAELVGIPILHIAYSLSKPNLERCLSLRYVAECITKGLELLKISDSEPTVASIWLDYLQILAQNDQAQKGVNDQRRLRVRSDMYDFRGLVQFFKAAGVLAVQAKQTLAYPYSRELPIPGLYDGEETSTIGQNTDRLLSVAMPKMFLRRGQTFRFPIGTSGTVYPVKDEHQFLWVVKQRGGLPSGKCFLLHHNYANGTVTVVTTDQPDNLP